MWQKSEKTFYGVHKNCYHVWKRVKIAKIKRFFLRWKKVYHVRNPKKNALCKKIKKKKKKKKKKQ